MLIFSADFGAENFSGKFGYRLHCSGLCVEEDTNLNSLNCIIFCSSFYLLTYCKSLQKLFCRRRLRYMQPSWFLHNRRQQRVNKYVRLEVTIFPTCRQLKISDRKSGVLKILTLPRNFFQSPKFGISEENIPTRGQLSETAWNLRGADCVTAPFPVMTSLLPAPIFRKSARGGIPVLYIAAIDDDDVDE